MISVICAYSIYLGVLKFEVSELPKTLKFYRNEYAITARITGTGEELGNWAIVEKGGRRLTLPLQCERSEELYKALMFESQGI